MTLTIAVAYGGREEISDAVKGFLKESLARGESLATVVDQVTPGVIAEHFLYSVDLPDPDLIIRTSGEIRLSGFLLWQSATAEFYFSDVYWPAFRKIDSSGRCEPINSAIGGLAAKDKISVLAGEIVGQLRRTFHRPLLIRQSHSG